MNSSQLYFPQNELFEVFTKEQFEKVDKSYIPSHVAIIPDGNRRWAKKSFFAPERGHKAGTQALTNIVNAARLIGIKTLTIYTFSTENWQRSKLEVSLLMKLLKEYLVDQRDNMIEKGIRLHTIGDLTPFSEDIIQLLNETKLATSQGNQIDLVLALNYGGRDEIRRAIHSIVDDIANKKIKKEELTLEAISSYLDTSKWKDPDLLIRTSGELRISNFLLWQISYSEIYTTSVLWPDFTPEHLLEAIVNYQKRERRLGGA